MPKNYKILKKARLTEELFPGADEESFDDALGLTEDLIVEPDELPAAEERLRPVELEFADEKAIDARARTIDIVPGTPAARTSWGRALAELTGSSEAAEWRSLGVAPVGELGSVADAAAALALWIQERAGGPVLIVELNDEAPALARLFLTRSRGLGEALSGRRDELEDVIYKTDEEGIEVLPAGERLPRRDRQRMAPALGEVFFVLRDKYPSMVVELPRADVALFRDLPAKRLVDGMLLVVDPARTTERQLRQAKENAAQCGAKVAAVLLGRPPEVETRLHMDRIARQVTVAPDTEDVEELLIGD